MSSLVPHNKKYLVQRQGEPGWAWRDDASYSWKWRALRAARYGQKIGVFAYRVVRTK